MKTSLLVLFVLFSIQVFSQVPEGLSYQATVRDNNGDLLLNQNVTFKFNIISGTPGNTPVYVETANLTTDDLGQVTAIIGQGNTQVGQFDNIEWASGTHHLGIELNTGNGFTTLGTTQFLSVPYSLYSKKSGSGKKSKTMLYLSDGF